MASGAQQRVGSIRGVVYDKDFEVPLQAAQVLIVETSQRAETGDQGTFVIPDVAAGSYTLVFAKEGYVRQVKADVAVAEGALTEVEVWLVGEYTEMDEFVVQDILPLTGGSEAALLALRMESPALMSSIGSELMSRAGASDAAAGLRLVSGASLQDGKTAVISGLPDRYVSSQMNCVRLPTADEDKRAVELDQFPATVIESLQVSKTFTPDQQGDASGGAVDVRLKGVPDETTVQFSSQVSHNSEVTGQDDFLSYAGGGVDFWGEDDGGRDIQWGNLGESWDGAVGVSEEDAPIDSKWSLGMGGKHELSDGVRIGGSANLFYERDSSFSEGGKNDSWWVDNPGEQLTPQTNQGTPSQGDFKTALFDVDRASQSVQWGGLATLGLETEHHQLGLSYLYTRNAEDSATLATDTRGKEYFFPGYNPNNPNGPGNEPENLNAAPYLRLETLEYTERETQTLQLTGRHELPMDDSEGGIFKAPAIDWVVADSSASMDQPDKRQFGALWLPRSFNPGVPPFVPPFTTEEEWFPYKPGANFNLGNLQRIWKEIDEDSIQAAANFTLPFEQWSGDEGYFKTGVFADQVDREFDQETFSNFGDSGSSFEGGWEEPWSGVFPFEDHPITASESDVDYDGEQDIGALYSMLDLPLASSLDLIGGVRLESTEIGIVNHPEEEAVWLPPGSSSPVALNPGDADVDFEQDDVLPSVGLIWQALEPVTLRGSYSETVARQTFKELSPILQQEYLGGPVFIGNPELDMSSLNNWDLRLDYVPFQGSLVSLSWFYKQITDPIEYVQRVQPFEFTTPVNYPEGHLGGWEIELRQGLGELLEDLNGLTLGANATFISSEVELPEDESAGFNLPNINVPRSSRDMTNAPEHLYNLYLTYDFERTGTQLGLFYTVQGDTLVAGAAQANGNFVPSIYATEFDTLNFSLTQKLGPYFRLQFQAKNLTNPDIETVYRSPVTSGDTVHTSYSTGVELALTLGAKFSW
jgi:TonB-dependent receptor